MTHLPNFAFVLMNEHFFGCRVVKHEQPRFARSTLTLSSSDDTTTTASTAGSSCQSIPASTLHLYVISFDLLYNLTFSTLRQLLPLWSSGVSNYPTRSLSHIPVLAYWNLLQFFTQNSNCSSRNRFNVFLASASPLVAM